MANTKKNSIIIWGAGKIGRGFVADIFSNNSYEIDFVDVDDNLVRKLNENKKYIVYSNSGKSKAIKKEISNYCAYSAEDIKEIDRLLSEKNLMAVVVFPEVFDSIAGMIANAIKLRLAANNQEDLNIFICANVLNAKKSLYTKLSGLLTKEEHEYANKHLGLIETVVIRVAIAPGEDMLKVDELVVSTDGYPDLIADGKGFKGSAPVLNNMIYVDDIYAEEVRKMYTYNMTHAFVAYLGGAKGYSKVYDAITDTQIRAQLRAVLEEVSQGLSAEFGFDEQEMKIYCEQVIDKFSNPVIEDTLVRVGGNVGRKVSRNERLVGAALLCRKHGIYPYYLAKGIAYAMHYNNPEDSSIAEIANKLNKENKLDAIMEICGLSGEIDFAYLIERHYLRYDGTLLNEDVQKVKILKKAFYEGYFNEKKYKGCAQCALLGMFAVNGEVDKPLFKATSGLSGGMAISGDGVCGGYSGGILYTGSISGRRYDEMLKDGDKQEQYNSYEMAQYLNDRFNECYGSVICSDIHKKVFDGRSYCLRTKEVRDKFEEAGAHKDKCTAVVANACVWIMEALWKHGFNLPQSK